MNAHGLGLWFVVSGAAAGEHIEVSASHSPRAFLDIARQVADSAQVPLSYEEPVQRCEARLEDVSSEVRRDGRSDPVLVPQRLSHSVSVDPKATPAEQLKAVVASWESAGHGTAYAVEEREGMVHLKPTAAWGADCTAQAYTPVLDTPLSGPPGTGTPLDLLGHVLGLLDEQHGVSLGLGTVPLNALGNAAPVTVELDGVRALDALAEILGSTYSWYLLYSANGGTLVLNLEIAAPEPGPELLTPTPGRPFNFD